MTAAGKKQQELAVVKTWTLLGEIYSGKEMEGLHKQCVVQRVHNKDVFVDQSGMKLTLFQMK